MFPPHWFRPHHLPPSPTISSSFFRPLCAYPLQLTNIANHSSPTPRHPPSSLATSYYAVDASDAASCCSIFYNDDAIRFHFDVDRIKQKEVNEKKIQTKREKKLMAVNPLKKRARQFLTHIGSIVSRKSTSGHVACSVYHTFCLSHGSLVLWALLTYYVHICTILPNWPGCALCPLCPLPTTFGCPTASWLSVSHTRRYRWPTE